MPTRSHPTEVPTPDKTEKGCAHMADERDNNFSLSDTENSRSHEPLPVTAADDIDGEQVFTYGDCVKGYISE